MKNMCEISVIMPIYNQGRYVKEAIESVLMQSFVNFEFIIIDASPINDILPVVQTYKDERIKFAQGKQDIHDTINKEIGTANGKYIAFMDSDSLMHIDRLKIQYAIMQEYANIVVCGTWMDVFNRTKYANNKLHAVTGFVEKPLLKLLQGNILLRATAMLRKDFVRRNALKYEIYPHAEDYKLWIEIAKLGGGFYIESQPLLFRQPLTEEITNRYKEEQDKSIEKVTNEILEYIIAQNKDEYPELPIIYNGLCKLLKRNILTQSDISVFYHNLFSKNERELKL